MARALCTSVAMHAAARYHAVSAATVVARPLACTPIHDAGVAHV